MPWPRGGVRFRGQMAGRRFGRIATGGKGDPDEDFALVVDEAEAVRSCGCGRFGQLGHGNRESEEQLTVIAALQGKRVLQVSAGGFHSLAFLEGGARCTRSELATIGSATAMGGSSRCQS